MLIKWLESARVLDEIGKVSTICNRLKSEAVYSIGVMTLHCKVSQHPIVTRPWLSCLHTSSYEIMGASCPLVKTLKAYISLESKLMFTNLHSNLFLYWAVYGEWTFCHWSRSSFNRTSRERFTNGAFKDVLQWGIFCIAFFISSLLYNTGTSSVSMHPKTTNFLPVLKTLRL